MKPSKRHGVVLRRSYTRVAKRAALMAGRYAHAKQFRRMRRMLKKLTHQAALASAYQPR